MHNLCMGTDASIDHGDADERDCRNRPRASTRQPAAPLLVKHQSSHGKGVTA